jgi:hypothetical protein
MNDFIFRFAFGFPPNSPYLDLFNNVILKFRESSDLETAWEEIKRSATTKENCEGVSHIVSVRGFELSSRNFVPSTREH